MLKPYHPAPGKKDHADLAYHDFIHRMGESKMGGAFKCRRRLNRVYACTLPAHPLRSKMEITFLTSTNLRFSGLGQAF